jgi:hypothetical protein
MALKGVADTLPPMNKENKFRRVGGRRACVEALGVSLSGTGSSADLGGSSKNSSESLEGWSGEGFR